MHGKQLDPRNIGSHDSVHIVVAVADADADNMRPRLLLNQEMVPQAQVVWKQLVRLQMQVPWNMK